MLYFSNQKPRFFRRGFLTTIIYLLSVSCTAEASVAVSQEVEQVLDFRGGGEFLFHFFYGFVEFQARAEEEAVGFLEGALDVGRDVVSCDAYAVQAYDSGGVAVGDDEGAYVLNDLGHAAYHGEGSYFDELVDAAHGADDSMVFDSDVAGNAGEAGYNDVIAEVAVVGYVGVCLKHVVRTDAGFAVFTGCTVDGSEFVDVVSISDDDGAVLACILEVLRCFSDDGVREDVVLLAHADVFCDDGVRFNDGAFSDFASRTDDYVWSDGDVFMNDSGRIDDGSRMNRRIYRFDHF